MELKVAVSKPLEISVGALIIPYGEKSGSLTGVCAEIDQALGGTISQLIDSGEVKGKAGEVTIIHTAGKIPAARIVVAGTGKAADFNSDVIRQAVGAACRSISGKGVKVAAVLLPAFNNIEDLRLLAQLVAEGAVLGSWKFKKYITSPDNDNGLETLQLVTGNETDTGALNEGMEKGLIMADAANIARGMINEPANFMTPQIMADTAVGVAEKYGLEAEIMDADKIAELGMNAVLGVAAGSINPPKFMVLKYAGNPASDSIDLALVGKAVTFDSGGISIKPSLNMEAMKMDMSGGASVIGAISAIARLKPAINVVALVAAVENLPDGKAQRPGDVVKTLSGKTVEIISTDAEGRLTLADVVTYAVNMGAKTIVDVATLTGAVVIALGEVTTALFANSQPLAEMIKAAGDEAGEYMWQLPMYKEYREQYKSDIADMKNVGGREAGSITAAMFVGEFAGDTPWAHLDIAGTAMISKDRKYWAKGGTGIPVRTLVNLAMKVAAGKTGN